MNKMDKAREAAWQEFWRGPKESISGETAWVLEQTRAAFDAGYAAATAKIERLEKALKQARLDFAFLSVRNLGKSIADKAVEAIDKALEPKDGEL